VKITGFYEKVTVHNGRLASLRAERSNPEKTTNARKHSSQRRTHALMRMCTLLLNFSTGTRLLRIARNDAGRF